MLQEIRLYYESIEQAYHYVLPLIQETVKEKDIEIKLVKMEKNYNYYSRRIASIIFWKEPDILMTVVENNEEYPLFMIEFSTAVFTEDHELQRFDGLLASVRNNCIYIKISPIKKVSPFDHGGNTEFNYVIPFSLIYSKYKKPSFHFEWKCDKNGLLITNPKFLSNPHSIVEFKILLRTIVKEVIKNGYSKEWINNVTKELQNYTFFEKWLNKLEKGLKLDLYKLDTSRTQWIKKDSFLKSEALELKINRFGHAMDPERGMIGFYGTLTSNVISKMVFSKNTNSWYKDIPKEKEIKNIVNNGLEKVYDFLLCFAYGFGLDNNNEFIKILEKYKNYTKKLAKIDLTEFIQKNFSRLSKPLKTIFTYSKIFVIEDDSGKRRVIFYWKPYQEELSYTKYPKITPIRKRRLLDEDDVTYIVVHNILKPNKYRIIAVSYPGAQGDRRILVQAGTGRRQPREYIDIISFLPYKTTILQENKGVYNNKGIQNDIDELSLYKTNKAYEKGLRNFLNMFAPKALNTSIKIGVGFWASKNFRVDHIKKLDLKNLDYFIYITKDQKCWEIWQTGKGRIFSITSGYVLLPKTYEIVKQKSHQKDLSSFIL
jgi:hypothetical protein